MKRVLAIAFLFISGLISAQSKVLCLVPSCSQKVHVGDTVFIGAQLTASDQFKSIAFAQSSGPSTSVIGSPITVYNSGIQASTQVQLTNLVPGVYVYNVTGLSQTNGTVSTLDSVTVLPATVCPVCPVCPPPPVITITSVTYSAGRLNIVLSNGQTLSL
jgi:hypothetical protein